MFTLAKTLASDVPESKGIQVNGCKADQNLQTKTVAFFIDIINMNIINMTTGVMTKTLHEGIQVTHKYIRVTYDYLGVTYEYNE